MSPDEIRFRVSSLKSRLLDRDEELGVAFLKQILFFSLPFLIRYSYNII